MSIPPRTDIEKSSIGGYLIKWNSPIWFTLRVYIGLLQVMFDRLYSRWSALFWINKRFWNITVVA